MKKVLGALGVVVLLAVLGVTLLFGYSVYKDIDNNNSQENKVADESKSNKENNKEEINNENENNTQNQTEVQENQQQEVQENNEQEVQNESTTEYPEDASTDVSNMNDLELMEYYMQYMDEEDRAITEGKVESQRGNEYVDSIREEVTNNPDIIEEWAN